MNVSLVPLAAPVAFVCFFCVFWVIVLFFCSFISGWHKAAKTNRAENYAPENQYRFRSAQIGLSNYSACLVFGTTETGLFIRVLFPLRPAHPLLFFPRSTISFTPDSVFKNSVLLQCEDCPGFKMKISKKFAETLVTDLGLTQE